MYFLILTLPLISTIISGLFGRWIGGRGAGIIGTLCIFLTFLISIFVFYEVAFLRMPCLISLSPWFTTEIYDLHWGFLFDSLTSVMLIVVTSISTLVHLYSTEYMGQDPHLPRFMAYLSFFTFLCLF